MHNCEFCNTQFESRPQVKNPRACSKEICQKKRQRFNEREWHLKNPGYADKKYHQIRREQRKKKLELILQSIMKCLEVGKDFLEINVSVNNFNGILRKFLFELGIRNANKLWIEKSGNPFDYLEMF